jgi:coproporphyrinogen III oxidase-like Fe-S oxidoreductase
VLQAIKDSGCDMLQFGIESGDADILKAMNKKLDLKKVEEVVRTGAEIGLRMGAFMIVGHPGETEQRFRNSLEFYLKLKRLGVEYFAIHIINVYPNTELYKICQEKGYLVNDDMVSVRNLWTGLGRLQRVNVDIVTCDFSPQDVINRRNSAYRKLMPVDYYLEKFAPVRNLLKKVIPQKLGSSVLRTIRKRV